MWTRCLRLAALLGLAALLALAAAMLGGCLLNTPTNVAKRFVASVKHLRWDKMEALVHWPSSERALGRPLRGDRREILTDVAESISAYEIRLYGEERAKSNFLFFKVAKVETLDRTDALARLQLDLKLSSEKSRSFEMTITKVGRTWRVVLTPNLLEKKYRKY